MIVLAWRGRERGTFIASTAAIVLSVASAAIALYPALLLSTTNPALNLTIYNSGTSHYAMTAGFFWGGIGLVLAFGYSAFAHYRFRGRVPPSGGHSSDLHG